MGMGRAADGAEGTEDVESAVRLGGCGQHHEAATLAKQVILSQRPSCDHRNDDASGALVRHKYGSCCISAPKPTIPSIINTSSPITIQPMFSSFELMALA